MSLILFRRFAGLLVLPLCFLQSSCFLLSSRVDKVGTITGYRNGRVSTLGQGSFMVNPLPKIWQRDKSHYRALIFRNTSEGSTIFVDSWCRGAMSDAPLATLAGQLLSGVEHFKIQHEKKIMLDGRQALHAGGVGKMDGHPVYLEYYVFKKDACMFHFLYTSIPESTDGARDFSHFVEGFRLLKSPRIL